MHIHGIWETSIDEPSGSSRRQPHTHNYAWFSLLYGKSQHSVVKQFSVKLKKKKGNNPGGDRNHYITQKYEPSRWEVDIPWCIMCWKIQRGRYRIPEPVHLICGCVFPMILWEAPLGACRKCGLLSDFPSFHPPPNALACILNAQSPTTLWCLPARQGVCDHCT